jgi:hypothetical protein
MAEPYWRLKGNRVLGDISRLSNIDVTNPKGC